MSKELEALLDLFNEANKFNNEPYKFNTLELLERKQIIEQALLKAQEQEKVLKEVKANLTIELNNKKNAIEMFKEERTLRENQEKVLDILKEKRVDLSYLRCCFEDNQSVERYNEYIRNKTMDYDHEEELTQEEFDLVKRYFK